MLEKKELRKRARELISNISTEGMKEKSLALSQNLKKVLDENSNGIVGVFAPLPAEPKWQEGLVLTNYQLAFPRVKENRKMDFALCKFDELLKQTHFGVQIFEPECNLPEVVPALILVPGLAFDRSGGRIGKGKGFYDNYLRNYKGLTIGITFNETLLDEIPTEEHDMSVEMVITDREVIKVP